MQLFHCVLDDSPASSKIRISESSRSKSKSIWTNLDDSGWADLDEVKGGSVNEAKRDPKLLIGTAQIWTDPSQAIWIWMNLKETNQTRTTLLYYKIQWLWIRMSNSDGGWRNLSESEWYCVDLSKPRETVSRMRVWVRLRESGWTRHQTQR